MSTHPKSPASTRPTSRSRRLVKAIRPTTWRHLLLDLAVLASGLAGLQQIFDRWL